MNKTYTSKDIVQMAIQAKAKSVDLYLALARNSENYHVGKLFTEFAKDEQRHKHKLEKLRDELSQDKQQEAYPGERTLYLKALVDTGVFNCDASTKQALETTISEEEALQAGITFEKDFMLFLHDMKRQVIDGDQGIVDELIEDEIKHLEQLFQAKEKIK